MKNLNIQKLRKMRGLSQSELAQRSGISQPAIGAIEAGKKSPTLRTMEKLASALGVKVADLLEDQAC